ncbi:B12-binding domain-containing protein [Rhabdothermincola sp.]|uniref:B12-binding domain-containing protein n=1 Tax=Rhabdothermincola sp. TaxID=2820405 RepID=UPI002FE1C438
MSEPPITLEEAARRLGVHYMTAYRYVRTGRLPATKAGGIWRVDPGDVRRLGRPRTTPSGRASRRRDYPRRLARRLVVGDEPGAWTVLQDALAAGMPAEELYLDLIAPALTAIGDDWAAGTVSIAQEHQASAVVLRLIGRLGPLFRRRGRTRGTVVLGAPPGDHHGIPSALVADLLRARGFSVIDLGSDTPAASFTDAAEHAERLVAVGIAATRTGNDGGIRSAVAAVRDQGLAPIVLGGAAVPTPARARQLGADHHSASASEALELFDQLAQQRNRPGRGQPA